MQAHIPARRKKMPRGAVPARPFRAGVPGASPSWTLIPYDPMTDLTAATAARPKSRKL